jgi:Na+/melibiose symporter-like transporter
VTQMSELTEVAEPTRRLSTKRLLGINAFWFGNGAHWQPITVILLPAGAVLVDKAHKELIVGRATAAGGIFALLMPMLVGWLSDKTSTRWGRRRPWMVGGAILNVIGLMLLSLVFSPLLVIALYLAIQAGNNIGGAAYTGVIPDVVPPAQRARASGLLGAMNNIGTVVGVVIVTVLVAIFGSGRAGLVTGYAALSVLLLSSLAVTCFATPEVPYPETAKGDGVKVSGGLVAFVAGAGIFALGLVAILLVPETALVSAPLGALGLVIALVAGTRDAGIREYFRPFADHDFRWVFLTRFLMQFGIYTIVPFITFYFTDVMRVKSPEVLAGIWLACVLAGGAPAAIICGHLSDKLKKRKRFVYLSGVIQAAVISVLLFGLITSLPVMFVLGVIFGIGYGIYYSVDWALACDVLPNPDTQAGKDMALWHISFTGPQVIAPALLAPVLYNLNRPEFTFAGVSGGNNLGYRVIFGSATLWFVIGTIMVRKIRKVR